MTLSAVEKVREDRESQLKNDLLNDLNQWFYRRMSAEKELEWIDRFKKLLQLQMKQPIPHDLTAFFRFWLLFDAPCLNGKRPVEIWASAYRKHPYKERVAKNFCASRSAFYELIDKTGDLLIYRKLEDGEKITVRHSGEDSLEKLIFARFVRIGNHYEVFGPYTSFLHEMRGEILVQLEKYNHLEEENNRYTAWDNGWKVYGWSIHRAEELKNSKTVSPSVTKAPVKKASAWPPAKTEKEELPIRIMQQFEQFFVQHVATLQKGTQLLYCKSMEKFHLYLSTRFGSSFDWSLLDEETLVHFLSVWYLDQGKSTPQGARIFLNTLKHLFRWLEDEGISEVYPVFRKVYIHLIRALPSAVEIRKWLLDHGINQEIASGENPDGRQETYLFTVSSTGPLVLIDGKWRQVHMSPLPSFTTERRFWVHGRLANCESGCYFTQIDGVYPVMMLDNSLQLLNLK
ncbi:MAG: hypothetical protein WB502_03155 [Thermoactinomyces sp.]